MGSLKPSTYITIVGPIQRSKAVVNFLLEKKVTPNCRISYLVLLFMTQQTPKKTQNIWSLSHHTHSYNKEWNFFQYGRVTASSKNRYPATTTKAHLLVTVWDYFSVVWLCLKHSGRSGYPSIQYTLYPLETSFYTPLDK